MYNIWLKQGDTCIQFSNRIILLTCNIQTIYCFLHSVLIFFTPKPTLSNLTLQTKPFILIFFQLL